MSKYFEIHNDVEVKAFAIAENNGRIADLLMDVAEIIVEKYDSRKEFNKWPEFEQFVKGYCAGYYVRATNKRPTTAWIEGAWDKKQKEKQKRKGDLDFQAFETARVQFMKVLAIAFPLPKREGGGGTPRGVNVEKFIAAVSGDDQELAAALRWALADPGALKAAYKAAQQTAQAAQAAQAAQQTNKRPRRKAA